MGVRSLGNDPSSFKYKFGRTGLEAVTPAPIPAPQVGGQTATGGTKSTHNGKTIHLFTSSGAFATTSDWTGQNVEYLVIGGGGGGGGSQGGGGGAGSYRYGTILVAAHPVSTTIQIGGGGNGGLGSPDNTDGTAGSPSYFGTPVTAPGGGFGGFGASGNDGGPGGSGGGTGYTGDVGPGTGDPFPGDLADSVPSNGWGHDGGLGAVPQNYGSGGGGGAGGAGTAGTPSKGGPGGAGLQVPSTFRYPGLIPVVGSGPTSAPTPNGFDTSGNYWVAGGGGASIYGPNPSPDGGTGGNGPGTTPWAGAGNAGGNNTGAPSPTNAGASASSNTGSGGGGGYVTSSPASTNGHAGGAGGSGLVLIAYPT